MCQPRGSALEGRNLSARFIVGGRSGTLAEIFNEQKVHLVQASGSKHPDPLLNTVAHRKPDMPFAITFFDDPQTDKSRKSSLRQIHIDYVSSNADRIIASGGLFPDDDDFPNGGLILLDVQSRSDAVHYIENDPFFVHGIFSSYTIVRWKKFVFDHRRV